MYSFQTKYLISKYYCVFDLNVHEILQLDVKQPIMKDLCNKMLYAIVDHLLCIVVGMHTYIAINNQNTQKINLTLTGKDDESPIPTKAALARSATKRSTPKKVPPIPAQSTERLISHQRDDDGDSAYATSLESTLAEESHLEVIKLSYC